MSTEWVVTTAAERIALDGQKHGETTFTVTNPGRRADRVVFEVVPSDGADRGWFSVEEPQRLVRGNASVAYLLKVAVGPAAPAGSYAVQARVYSADSAPEESSVLSGRVMLEVKPEPKPEPKKRPWWWLVVAALVLIVLVVVGYLVFSGGDAPAKVAMPDVTKKTEVEATAALRAAGLNVGKVVHKHDPTLDDQAPTQPAADQVLTQSSAAGAQLDRGTTVDLEVAVLLAAPTLTEPAKGAALPRGAKPTLTWTQAEPWVTTWTVVVSQQVCVAQFLGGPVACQIVVADIQEVHAPELVEPQLMFLYRVSPYPGSFHSGVVTWQVTPLDETGKPGQPSPVGDLRIGA